MDGMHHTGTMKLRYELIDTHNPTWRGERRTSLDAARKLEAAAFPPGRFVLKDRLTKEII